MKYFSILLSTLLFFIHFVSFSAEINIITKIRKNDKKELLKIIQEHSKEKKSSGTNHIIPNMPKKIVTIGLKDIKTVATDNQKNLIIAQKNKIYMYDLDGNLLPKEPLVADALIYCVMHNASHNITAARTEKTDSNNTIWGGDLFIWQKNNFKKRIPANKGDCIASDDEKGSIIIDDLNNDQNIWEIKIYNKEGNLLNIFSTGGELWTPIVTNSPKESISYVIADINIDRPDPVIWYLSVEDQNNRKQVNLGNDSARSIRSLATDSANNLMPFDWLNQKLSIYNANLQLQRIIDFDASEYDDLPKKMLNLISVRNNALLLKNEGDSNKNPLAYMFNENGSCIDSIQDPEFPNDKEIFDMTVNSTTNSYILWTDKVVKIYTPFEKNSKENSSYACCIQ